ncbi:MAG: 50S ribosomal protein L3 N(5)-glutamine methyltransferase [Pseudomonadales bacterium]
MRAGDLIQSVSEQFERAELFYGHGTDNEWDEAVALVLGVTGLPDEDASLHTLVPEAAVRKVLGLAERRVVERVPLPYLLGRWWFAGYEFLVEPGVIVPRSPIAELITHAFRPWLRRAPARVLDLCCGGGCIGIATALTFPDSEVVMTDIDPAAVALARRNIALHGLETRVRVLETDLYDGVEGRFDMILTNPPYVDAVDLAALPPEYAHEPVLALDGGGDGLDLMRRILAGAPARLSPGGILVGEVGASAAALCRSVPALPFVWVDLEDGGDGVFVLDAEAFDTKT